MRNNVLCLGFKQVDENEYSNGVITIFIIDDDHISIIGNDLSDGNYLDIPIIRIDDFQALEHLLMSLNVVNNDV